MNKVWVSTVAAALAVLPGIGSAEETEVIREAVPVAVGTPVAGIHRSGPGSRIELPLPDIEVGEAGTTPLTGKARWTMYYVVDIPEPRTSGGGIVKTLELLDGSKVKYYWHRSEVSKMQMEASAVIVRTDGSEQIITRVGKARWQALPPDKLAKGNRENMLYPWVHVAADQSLYPFGSRIFCEEAVGVEMPDGTIHDGFLWVADTGGRIKGSFRIDLFVGRSNVYSEMMNRDRNPAPEVTIDRLPKPPKGLDPKTRDGTRAILAGLGYPKDPEEEGGTYAGALLDFQRLHPHIPEVEHGNLRGAITLWHLTQAARAVAESREAD